jgi:hypothetical protein
VALALAISSIVSVQCQAWTGPTLALAPVSWTTVAVARGGSALAVFNVTGGGGFQGAVSLAITGLPSGVTASWSQNPLSLGSGVGASTLTLSASSAAAIGSTTFSVTASGGGVSTYHNYLVKVGYAPGVQVQLSHQSLTMWSMATDTVVLTATPIGGVVPSAAGSAPTVVSGLPTGISATWSAPSVSITGALLWTLTLTGSPQAVASSGTLVLGATLADANTGQTYSASASVPLTVSYNTPTLHLSAAVNHVPIEQGLSANDVFTVTGGGSFHGPVTLTVSGLPSTITGTFSNPTVTPNAGTSISVLTLGVSPNTPVNAYVFTVTASGDGLTLSQTYSVSVRPTTGVQVQLSQTSVSINSPGTATVQVTAAPINGASVTSTAGAAATVVSGLPSGVTASWSSPTLSSAGAVTWTLTFTAAAGAQTSTDPIQLSEQITDGPSGFVYPANQSVSLLVSLLANVAVGETPVVTIPATFMGLSLDWGGNVGAAQGVMGSAATGVNQIYRQMLNNLTSYGGGPLSLRIGGNNTDSLTAPPTSTTCAPLAQLAQATGVHFTLGVNLGANNVNLAVQQAQAYMSQMPPGTVDAIEIGNEPDLYYKNGMRPSTYTQEDFFADFRTWADNIIPVVPPGTKLMAPAWAYYGTMQSYLPSFFETSSANYIGLVSQHSYATSPANNPAPDFLLTPVAATSGPIAVAPAVAATHNLALPFRIGEMNSISDGGVNGISNAFGASLWAVDTMFEYANVGVDGVNWMSTCGTNFYAPFCFSSTNSNGKTVYTLTSVNPLYYGLLFFQAALGGGAELLPTSVSTPANLKAWATVPAGGTPHVVLINKDETQTGTVAVAMPGYTQASVLRLTAPSYTSAKGISFGGQTFDGSTDGTLQGSKSSETVTSTDGVFYVKMPITSAALLIFNN